MKKLKKGTKPKRLTLGQIWKLYCETGEVESAEFIAKTLDAYYPDSDREGVDVLMRMQKYQEAKRIHSSFTIAMKELV